MQIHYKFLKNRHLPIPFGAVRISRFVEIPTPLGSAVVPQFDMEDRVHTLTLADEEPERVERTKGMSAKLFSALQDEAVKAAIERKKENIQLKALFDLYCTEGVLERVEVVA